MVRGKVLAGLALFGLSLASVAQAHTVVLSYDGEVTLGGITTYSYDVTLSSANSVISSGDTFTMYDIDGLLPGAVVAPGVMGSLWGTVTEQPFGPTYLLPGNTVAPSTDTGALNLTATYLGSTMTNSGSDIHIGTLTFESIFQSKPNTSTLVYITQDEHPAGTLDNVLSSVQGPSGSGTVPAPLPAASSVGMVTLLGTAGFALGVRRRRTVA